MSTAETNDSWCPKRPAAMMKSLLDGRDVDAPPVGRGRRRRDQILAPQMVTGPGRNRQVARMRWER